MARPERPERWTEKLVSRYLVLAWQAKQRDTLAAEIIGWPATHLREKEHAHLRDVVNLWAARKAGIGEVMSIAAMGQERGKGWSRSTFNRERKRACRIIAERLNQAIDLERQAP